MFIFHSIKLNNCINYKYKLNKMFREFKFDNTRFDDGNKKRMIKIVFLGPSNAGKTTIINQFINNLFNREHIKTNDAVKIIFAIIPF